MSMSDCEKCWDTPCICGHDYKDRNIAYRLELASVVLGISLSKLQEMYASGIIPEVHPKSNNEKWGSTKYVDSVDFTQLDANGGFKKGEVMVFSASKNR